MTTNIREALGELAAGQHGVLTLQQVLDAGATRTFAQRRLRSGEWRRVGHRLLITNGSPRTPRQTMAIAVMSRSRALLSGRSAAWLHGMPGVGLPIRPEITVPYSANSRSPLAVIRRSHHFSTIAVEHIDGIVSATRAETLFRMSEYVARHRLIRMVDDELLRDADATESLGEIYLRHQGERMRGMATLRPILLERLDGGFVPTESQLEALADDVLADLDTPQVKRQAPIPWAPRAGRVDRLIAPWKLIIELDGRAWHVRTDEFERDRRRDNAAVAHGYATLRLTWRMLKDEPGRCRRLILEAGRSRAERTG